MSVIEIDKFTGPISADSPAGAEVEYDPEYMALETLAQGTPESVMGDEVKPAEEPDLREVKSAALKLFDRTRDLRVAMLLATALLKQDGLGGFRDGIAVVRGFIDKLWEQFYPKLDPSDNNDPTIRVNILKGFDGDGSASDVYKFKLRLREATLTNSKQKIGRFGFRDIQIARGEIPPPAAKPDDNAPKAAPADTNLINAAFEDTPTEDLQATQATVQEIIIHFTAIDAALGSKIGAGTGPDLMGIKDVLKQLHAVLAEQLSKRGIGAPAGAADAPGGASASDASSRAGGGGGGGAAGGAGLSGGITSRNDVIRALDMICAYYERYEPASPIPMFMKRAKRLVTLSFVDLIKDLAPEAMQKIDVFTGGDPNKT